MLQDDDRIILGNVAKVIAVLVIIMLALIGLANYLS
jgi:type IV secretory pathway VirB2 component (pilin)